MERLFLRLPALAGGEISAVSYAAGQWQRMGTWKAIDAIAQELMVNADVPVVIVTPVGVDIALVIEASARQRKEAGNSLVVLAEEQLGEDFERLQWSLSEINEHSVLARGISLAYLQQWLSLLHEQGIRPVAAIPESALLQSDSEYWLWYPVGDEVYLQAELGEAALVAEGDATMVLEQLLTRRKDSAPVRLHYPQGVTLPTLPERISPSPASWQDWADLLRQQTNARWAIHPHNWLTGTLAPQSQYPWSPRWKWSIAMLVAACLAMIISDSFMTYTLRSEAAVARAEAEQSYRQYFPEERRITNLARQFAARQAAGNTLAPEVVMQLVAQTAPSANWQIKQFDYRDNVPARIDVAGGVLDEINDWSQALEVQGMSVKVENARLDNGVAQATLLVASAGGKR
jgi:type II secretion system protein L